MVQETSLKTLVSSP